MTQEKKASIILELMAIGLESKLNGSEMLSVNEANSTRNAIDALERALAALSEPVLDENGLAPCGCGGRAQMVVNGWKEFSAFCPNCGFESAQYPSEEDVKIKWNAMRGVKEADK